MKITIPENLKAPAYAALLTTIAAIGYFMHDNGSNTKMPKPAYSIQHELMDDSQFNDSIDSIIKPEAKIDPIYKKANANRSGKRSNQAAERPEEMQNHDSINHEAHAFLIVKKSEPSFETLETAIDSAKQYKINPEMDSSAYKISMPAKDSISTISRNHGHAEEITSSLDYIIAAIDSDESTDMIIINQDRVGKKSLKYIKDHDAENINYEKVIRGLNPKHNYEVIADKTEKIDESLNRLKSFYLIDHNAKTVKYFKVTNGQDDNPEFIEKKRLSKKHTKNFRNSKVLSERSDRLSN